MDYKSKLKNNIKYIYLYNFLNSLVFAYVIERLFWRSRGISVVETVYLEAVYAIVILVLEVPSGVWADLYRRKDLIVFGNFLAMMEMLILVFARGFIPFAIVMAVAALSGAVTSGSTNALIYDTLTELGRENEFEKINGRIRAFQFSSHTMAALIGGYIAHNYGLLINYKLSVVSVGLAVLFSMLLIEPKRQSHEDEDKSSKFMVILNSSIAMIKKDAFLKYVVVVGVVIGSTMTYMWEFWQNYAEAIGIEVVYFGFVSALCSVGVMLSASKAYTVLGFMKKRKISKKTLYQGSMLIVGLCFVGMYFNRTVASVLLLVLMNLVAGIYETAIEGDIHHRVQSHNRATVESVYSMMLRVSTIGVGIAFGYVSDIFGIFEGFGILGVITLLSCFVLFGDSTKDEGIKESIS